MKCSKDFFMKLVFGVTALMVGVNADAASVVSRGKVASRAPVAKQTEPVKQEVVKEQPVVVEKEVEQKKTPFEFESRENLFTDALAGNSESGTTSDSELSEMIRRQRDALNAADSAAMNTANADAKRASGKNECDSGLRACMLDKCGAGFTKCSGDTDTAWGNKMDACRRDTKCSGTEYKLFAAEIKADRDVGADLANFEAIINCGNRYNACIIENCGTKFSKCLGKSSGDAAIAKCKSIQTECTKMDNGLAARMMNVFAGVRQDAEKKIKSDEERLYGLRDEMREVCQRLGASFDERSLDCVYTINFFANNSTTPYASKKSYAGGVFDCEPGWFGVDVTTFKENAYRLTASQKSASASMLGAGAGVAVGAVSSGAIGRAVETHKAKKEVKAAEKEIRKNKINAVKDCLKSGDIQSCLEESDVSVEDDGELQDIVSELGPDIDTNAVKDFLKNNSSKNKSVRSRG